MWHTCRRKEVCTGYWWGTLNKRDHFEDLGIEGEIILKWMLGE
jgi:hypothetical protein